MGIFEWRAELARSALRFGVLLALADAPRHGYELREVLRRGAFPDVQGGTLYPLLRRLEEQGLVTHRWDTPGSGPARKVVALTDQGRDELGHARAAWAQLTNLLAAMDTERVAGSRGA